MTAWKSRSHVPSISDYPEVLRSWSSSVKLAAAALGNTHRGKSETRGHSQDFGQVTTTWPESLIGRFRKQKGAQQILVWNQTQWHLLCYSETLVQLNSLLCQHRPRNLRRQPQTRLILIQSGRPNTSQTHKDIAVTLCRFCLQCFDAVGWAAGRASGL